MAKRKTIKKPTLKDVVEQSERTSDALDKKIKGNQRSLLLAIKNLEKRVVSEFSTLDLTDTGNLVGPRVNLKKAQHLHSRLTALFEEEYGTAVKEQIGGYNEVAGWIKDNFEEFDVIAQYTDVDRTMMTQLRKQSLLEFTNIGRDAQTKITQSLYNSVAAGAPMSDLVTAITGALVGHVDARGRPLSKYAELYANDGLMNFYNSVHIEKGKQAGLDHYLYVGDVIRATRDFCAKRAMEVYSEEEINSWTHNWSGKRGPAMIYRGGWNCRHHWRAVRPEWVKGKKAEAGIEAPPGMVKLPAGAGRNWEDFTKAERSKLSTMRRKMNKGFVFKPNSPRTKWWWGEMNQAERDMFINAWRSEGIDVSAALLKQGAVPPIAPIVKKKKKIKRALKKKIVTPEPTTIQPEKAEKIKVVVPKSTGDASKDYLAAQKFEREMAKAYKEGTAEWGDWSKAKDRLFDTKVTWVSTLKDKALIAERRKVLDSMLDTLPEHKKKALKAMQKGTSHIPYRLLADMDRAGLRVEYAHFAGRGSFSDIGRISLYKTHDLSRVAAHEFGHAIDSFLGSGARGFGDTFGKWATSPYATKEEAKAYRSWFMKNRLESGAKGTFYNGDGQFWKGKWIENYEARIYRGTGVFHQFFSKAMERYNKAVTTFMSDQFDNQVSSIKSLIDRKMLVLKELNPKSKEYRTVLASLNQHKAELDELFPVTKTYEQAKWDWAMNRGIWKKQKKFYPEFAKWTEDFFERVNAMVGRSKYEFGITHKLKAATETIIDEVKKVDVGKMAKSTVEKVVRAYKSRTEKWAETSWKAWFDGLNQKEIDALTSYTSDMFGEGVSDYIHINNFLRKGKPPLSARLKKVVKNMDSAIQKGFLSEDTTLWRGIDGKYLKYFEDNKGKVIIDKGFTSTSVRKSQAISYMDQAVDMQLFEDQTLPIMAKIQAPKGVKAGFLSYPEIDLELFADAEVLLDRKTKYRIVDIVKRKSPGMESYSHYWEVLMEVVL
jgi:hypothetical protein